jgi:ABC-2 type transport system permease protein
VNTGLAPVILLVLGVASFFFKADIEGFLVQMMEVDMPLEPLLLILFGFSIVMTYTPAISLSLEGKNFWILKSLPIEPRTIMISKIIFNGILIVPIALISVVMLGFNLSIQPLSIFVMMYVIVSLSLLSSLINAYVNLFMPKFDFQNEVEVVKQSIASLVGVFGGFAIIVTFGFAYYFMNNVMPMQATLFIIGTIMAMISFVLYIYLKPVSEKQFNQF